MPLKPATAIPTVRGALLPGDARDTHYYVWFFTNAVGDFVMSHSFSTAFWHKMFQLPSQTADCVRHAVVALGAVHWQFSRHDPLLSSSSSSSSTASLNQFALQHYNQAISSLVKARDTPHDMVTTVTCCFLFILIESLRGDFSEALRHLEAGMTILASHQPAMSLPTREIQELASMFSAISGQVGLFSETRLFPDLSHFQLPMKKYKRRSVELRDLDEAEDDLHTFDDLFTTITVDLEQDWDSPGSKCETQWEILRVGVERWKHQFITLVDQLKHEGRHDANLDKINNLWLQYEMWEVLIEGLEQNSVASSSPDSNWSSSVSSSVSTTISHDTASPEACPELPNLDVAKCNALLDQADQLWYSTSLTRFSLKSDLLVAIYQLYVFCLDEGVRRRIISMLRARNRREIIWDSAALADFLEKNLARGELRDRWPDLGPSPSDEALVVFRPRHPAVSNSGSRECTEHL